MKRFWPLISVAVTAVAIVFNSTVSFFTFYQPKVPKSMRDKKQYFDNNLKVKLK